MPLPLFAAALRRAQKELRQQAQGFSCAFRHFLLRFSKYFLPHVSTLFNMLHGRVFAWRVGGVGWHAAAAVHWLKAKSDASKLSANE